MTTDARDPSVPGIGAPRVSAMSPVAERSSLALARRTALAAQGLATPRPRRPATLRDVSALIDRLAQFQIDTINVVERAQYLPLFSRLGPYDKALLDRAAYTAPRRMFEYWGHAASLVDVRLEPHLRWRMQRFEAGHPWGFDTNPGLTERCLAELAERGPLTSRQIEHDEERSRDHWGWNWSAVKRSLEWLHSTGRVTTARRNSSFERVVDLRERVLPASVLAQADPGRDEAYLELVRRAARALGIGTVRCLADYFRLSQAGTRAAVAQLVANGELVPTQVQGWAPAWRWHESRRPRSVTTRALLSPFDSMVFERNRVLSLFGVHYRIEIYVPEAQRRFGYYSYLFALDDQLRARVDLKAERRTGRLLVQAAWLEPENEVQGAQTEPGRIAAELAVELAELAQWQGLGDVAVVGRGDLAPWLARALG